jgi:hypothetical protein
MWREGAVYANGKRHVNTGCYGAYHEWKIGSKAPREMSREEAWASCREWRGVLQANRVILAGENTVGLASHIRHGKFGEVCDRAVFLSAGAKRALPPVIDLLAKTRTA